MHVRLGQDHEPDGSVRSRQMIEFSQCHAKVTVVAHYVWPPSLPGKVILLLYLPQLRPTLPFPECLPGARVLVGMYVGKDPASHIFSFRDIDVWAALGGNIHESD